MIVLNLKSTDLGLGVAHESELVEPLILWWNSEAVSNFPKLDYSLRDVRRAGEALRGNIPWDTPEQIADALRIFAIANSWRDSHLYPMQRVRDELGGHLQRLKLRQSGITVARLKMMPSIRRKLAKIKSDLNQIQDLAGCRVIVPTLEQLKRIVDYHLEHSVHDKDKPYDYILQPKTDGYRSFHQVFKFKTTEEDEAKFLGRRVEIQYRTRLQHSWATAVEAVGLFRKEDIKGGGGDPDWRRLFELMSSEFAVAEGCPEVPNAPSHSDRLKEIKDIDRRIHAANTLENLSQAFNYTEMYTYEKAKYFIIEYDSEQATVRVRPHSTPLSGSESFDNVEAEIRGSGKKIKAILVAADKIESLKKAYPNYFGDVQVFKASLKRIARGERAVEYKLPPQRTVPPPPKVVPDTSWFRRPRFRKPKGA